MQIQNTMQHHHTMYLDQDNVNNYNSILTTVRKRYVHFLIAGYLSPMDDLTVSGYCYMTIDHHTPTVNHITTLDVKSFAKLMVTTHQDATTTLEGDTLDVRSGALVRFI